MTLGAGSMLPAWLVLPPAAAVLLVIAAHVNAVRGEGGAAMPESRKRLRTASGVLMMVVTCLLAYALGIVDPNAKAGMFAMAWMSVAVMLFMVVILAGLDALNTLKINHSQRQELREQLREVQRIVDQAKQETPELHLAPDDEQDDDQ